MIGAGKTLAGITVVALEQAVAAPLATSRLADAGARVIKLERQDGDFARHYDDFAEGSSSYFVWLNRDKESCRVDLRQQADRCLVQSMIQRADVFIQNLAPGATDRLGLGSAALRKANPRLITCDVRGYAADTPYAARKAYDLMIQAESGLSSITGTPDSGPSRVGVSLCDIATGLTAHAQILEALLARHRTGEGQAISVALFDVAAEMMNIPYIAARYGNAPPGRVGLSHPSIAPYGAYETQDGALLLAVQNDREWANLCVHVLLRDDMIHDPRFARNAMRIRNRAAMDAIIGAVFAAHPRRLLADRLDRGRIAYGQLSELADLLSHTAVSRMSVSAEGESIEMVAPPAVINGQRRSPGTVPALGEHDALLRKEFGASPGRADSDGAAALPCAEAAIDGRLP